MNMHHHLSVVLRSALTLILFTTFSIVRAQESTDAFAGPNFFRRFRHSSIVVGDYLYIDGGVVQIQTNGTTDSLSQNITYSLPLSTSWDSSNVAFTPIEKGDDVPNYNGPNLFLASDNASFYSFNGAIAAENKLDVPKQSAELWSFTPDRRGRGTWEFIGPADSSITQSVWTRSTSGNGSVYLLGGIQDYRSSPALYDLGSEDRQSADGLVTYNLETRTWLNQSITGPYPNGWIWAAQLYYLAGFGEQDLLLSMGGSTTSPGAVAGDDSFVPYNTVAIYNTVTNEWRNQTTTGMDIPDARADPCSWGAEGGNGTFEIFIYGGAIGASETTQSKVNIDLARAVYVLSLPSFTWHRYDYPEVLRARSDFTCTTINRQMIAIGGIEPDISSQYEDPDPWPQGIGILDLNEMEWSTSFDSAAGPYRTPQQIKDYLAANGQYPQQWNDNMVESWFTRRSPSSTNGTDTTTPAASPSPTSSSAESESSNNTGSIVGGVIGGIGGALLIAGLAWSVVRRRRRTSKSRPDHHSQHAVEKAELDSNHRASTQTLSSNTNGPWNANGQSRELTSKPVMEMDGLPAQRYELPSNGKR